MQDHGKGNQPVAFANKVNSVTQARYSITELECMAVVWSVRLFRPYLYGRRFAIVTDHAALKWLMTKREPSGRLHRWALTLQEFDFDVEYRPGRENVVPDDLSRAPVLRTTAPTQLTAPTIAEHQTNSVMCSSLADVGTYQQMRVWRQDGLWCIATPDGCRVVLPPSLWPIAFKECHDSIWSGHLREKQTLDRMSRSFWWPRMRRAVRDWVQACQDCGSRKARPSQVVPPLRSITVGDLCDRWALNLAGLLPLSRQGNRYVIASVEYLSKFVVAVPVPNKNAETIARVLVEQVVFRYGPFRELLTDGAAELTGDVVTQLVNMLQARQSTPVPYRPNLVGLVERFNRTWKDVVSIYVEERQRVWDEWLPSAAFAYNSARNTVTGFSPNVLMTGRELQLPNVLQLPGARNEIRALPVWHQRLVRSIRSAHDAARAAIAMEQARQARYYNRRSRSTRDFRAGMMVWVFRAPKGPGVTKLRHGWRGPTKIVQSVGFDNFEVEFFEDATRMVVHVSCLNEYHTSDRLLEQSAADLRAQLARDEAAPQSSRSENTLHGVANSAQPALSDTTAMPALSSIIAQTALPNATARTALSDSAATTVQSLAVSQGPAATGRRTSSRLAAREARSVLCTVRGRAQRPAKKTPPRGPEDVPSDVTQFIERRCRWSRNRVGRYCPHVEVVYLNGEHADETAWLTVDAYEGLWAQACRVEDDFESEGGE